MKKQAKVHLGFTLIEVMIALAVFSVFAVAFVTAQGYGLADSSDMRKEQFLQQLCQNKLSEILLDPPKLNEALTLKEGGETKSFEDYPEYEYNIKYKQFELPSIEKFKAMGASEDDETSNDDDQSSESQAVEAKVYSEIQRIMKEALWQITVTVKNKEDQFPFSLSTWLINDSAKYEFKY